MSIIPCEQNAELQQQIVEYADALKTRAHTLGDHGLDENEFYDSGLFRGAIERIRGQFSATMREKREFATNILNYMQDRRFILNWASAGDANRHDYSAHMPNGKVAVIELKGCLDGNNTTIYERPPHAQEFIIWSLCSNPGADPRHNVWSGIHTRLSADIIERAQQVDGVVIWDWVCGTVGRPCPKLRAEPTRTTTVAHYKLPPPCVYVFPATVPSPRNNPRPLSQNLADVQILQAFHECFGGRPEEVNHVDFEVEHRNADTLRKTRVRRNGVVVQESLFTSIRRV